MKAWFLVLGCLAMAGCASVAPKPSNYGVLLTSRLAQPQYMTLQISGMPFCSGEVSLGNPLRCKGVAQPPTMIKAVWGPQSSWSNPAGNAESLPADWKVASGPTQQRNLAAGWLHAPWWFRSGDVMLFTINRMHRLSVTFQCNRPGHACTSYLPFTSFGRPQGVTPLPR